MLNMDFSVCSEASYCHIEMGADHTEVLVKILLERLFRLSHVWMCFPCRRSVCETEEPLLL